uniref:ATP-dependent RNA helicase n=1 Tax=Panagrellus redivivus TaxID=6233 RepID=A0A7E4VNA5_PANRE
MNRRGLFEEDESYYDDDEDATNSGPTPSKPAENDSDEEDPLDAYMNGIEKSAKEAKEEVLRKEQSDKVEVDGGGRGRGDIDEEDAQESYFRYFEENRERLEAVAAGEELDDDGYLVGTKKEIAPLPTVNHKEINYVPRTMLKVDLQYDVQKRLQFSAKVKVDSNINLPSPVDAFDQLPFNEETLKLLQIQDIAFCTPVQAQGIPIILSNKDLIAISQTGSGKTLAFVLPMLEHVKAQEPLLNIDGGPIGLVVAPTRELATQLFKTALPFCEALELTIALAIGGENLYSQKCALALRPHIVVCTPGRLMEHIEKENTDMKRTTFLVFDEADVCFQMGMQEQINSIVNFCRPDRQTVMFSATFAGATEKFARRALTNPVKITVDAAKVPDNIKQRFLVLNESEKMEFFRDRLEPMAREGKVIIFVNKIEKVKQVVEFLRSITKIEIGELHGNMHQYDRTTSLQKFRDNVDVLVTTNVGSRGLDIVQVQHVVNYDAAGNVDTHIHRIGRTGRASESGTATTLLTKADNLFVKALLPSLKSDPEALRVFEEGIPSLKADIERIKSTLRKADPVLSRLTGPPPPSMPSSSRPSLPPQSAAYKNTTTTNNKYQKWGFVKASEELHQPQQYGVIYPPPPPPASGSYYPPPPPPPSGDSAPPAQKKSRWG